jgi:predicted aspartyl protease
MQRRLAILLLLSCPICYGAIVIPVEIESRNPITTARINGVNVQLIIDSGGGLLSLKAETIKKVSAVPTQAAISSTDALGITSNRATFKVDVLELGSKRFADIEADEISGYAANSPGDGIIGKRLLNQFVAVYDYPSRKITLYSSKERTAIQRECRGIQVDTVPDLEGAIVSMATMDHQSMRMLWDTGATYSFVKKSFADEHNLPVQEVFYTTQRFELGQHDFGPLKLVVLDLKAPGNVDGYLGYNFFANHVVCIDPSTHHVTVREQ